MLYGYEDGGFGIPDDDEPDFDYPQTPAPESEDGDDYGYVYDNDYPQSPAADYCPDVVEGISTCQDFLNGHEDSPSSACCDRLYDLSFIGVEVGLRDMCDCFKDLQASFHQSRAEDEIFKNCGFDYSLFPISQQECSKY
nr:non-specific lipid-transfer protein A-like [Ipomoea batatas]